MVGVPFQLYDIGLREIAGKLYLDDAFSVIPGDKGLELQLKIWRRHRRRVEAVVEALRRRTSSNP